MRLPAFNNVVSTRVATNTSTPGVKSCPFSYRGKTTRCDGPAVTFTCICTCSPIRISAVSSFDSTTTCAIVTEAVIQISNKRIFRITTIFIRSLFLVYVSIATQRRSSKRLKATRLSSSFYRLCSKRFKLSM